MAYRPKRAALNVHLAAKTDFESFFAGAPSLHSSRVLVTGVICGVRIEEFEDPLMMEVRRLDKLIDELAKGRSMGKVRASRLGLPGRLVQRSRRHRGARNRAAHGRHGHGGCTTPRDGCRRRVAPTDRAHAIDDCGSWRRGGSKLDSANP